MDPDGYSSDEFDEDRTAPATGGMEEATEDGDGIVDVCGPVLDVNRSIDGDLNGSLIEDEVEAIELTSPVAAPEVDDAPEDGWVNTDRRSPANGAVGVSQPDNSFMMVAGKTARRSRPVSRIIETAGSRPGSVSQPGSRTEHTEGQAAGPGVWARDGGGEIDEAREVLRALRAENRNAARRTEEEEKAAKSNGEDEVLTTAGSGPGGDARAGEAVGRRTGSAGGSEAVTEAPGAKATNGKAKAKGKTTKSAKAKAKITKVATSSGTAATNDELVAALAVLNASQQQFLLEMLRKLPSNDGEGATGDGELGAMAVWNELQAGLVAKNTITKSSAEKSKNKKPAAKDTVAPGKSATAKLKKTKKKNATAIATATATANANSTADAVPGTLNADALDAKSTSAADEAKRSVTCNTTNRGTTERKEADAQPVAAECKHHEEAMTEAAAVKRESREMGAWGKEAKEAKEAKGRDEGGFWLRVRVHSSWGGVDEQKRVGLDSFSLMDGEGKQLPLTASSLVVYQGLTQAPVTHATKSQLERLVDGRHGGGEERHQWIVRHAGPVPLEIRTKLKEEWLDHSPITLVLHNLSGTQRFVLGARDIEVIVGSKSIFEGEVSAGPMVSGRGSPVSHSKLGGAGRVSPGAAGAMAVAAVEGVLEMIVIDANGQPPYSALAQQAVPDPSPIGAGGNALDPASVAHAEPPVPIGDHPNSGAKPMKTIPIRSFGEALGNTDDEAKGAEEGKAEGEGRRGDGGDGDDGVQPIWFTPRQQTSPNQNTIGAESGTESVFNGHPEGGEDKSGDGAVSSARPGSSLSAMTSATPNENLEVNMVLGGEVQSYIVNEDHLGEAPDFTDSDDESPPRGRTGGTANASMVAQVTARGEEKDHISPLRSSGILAAGTGRRGGSSPVGDSLNSLGSSVNGMAKSKSGVSIGGRRRRPRWQETGGGEATPRDAAGLDEAALLQSWESLDRFKRTNRSRLGMSYDPLESLNLSHDGGGEGQSMTGSMEISGAGGANVAMEAYDPLDNTIGSQASRAGNARMRRRVDHHRPKGAAVDSPATPDNKVAFDALGGDEAPSSPRLTTADQGPVVASVTPGGTTKTLRQPKSARGPDAVRLAAVQAAIGSAVASVGGLEPFNKMGTISPGQQPPQPLEVDANLGISERRARAPAPGSDLTVSADQSLASAMRQSYQGEEKTGSSHANAQEDKLALSGLIEAEFDADSDSDDERKDADDERARSEAKGEGDNETFVKRDAKEAKAKAKAKDQTHGDESKSQGKDDDRACADAQAGAAIEVKTKVVGKSEAMELGEDEVVIPVTPEGRHLRMTILSTWGDPHYVGLAGVEVFDAAGLPMKLDDVKRQVTAHPADINTLEGYGVDPRTVDKLFDDHPHTCDDLHQWLAPFDPLPDGNRDERMAHMPNKVEVDFGATHSLGMIRIWNYNKSRTHASRGVRRISLSLDEQVVFTGEVRRATGSLTEPEACSEIVLFTVDGTSGSGICPPPKSRLRNRLLKPPQSPIHTHLAPHHPPRACP